MLRCCYNTQLCSRHIKQRQHVRRVSLDLNLTYHGLQQSAPYKAIGFVFFGAVVEQLNFGFKAAPGRTLIQTL